MNKIILVLAVLLSGCGQNNDTYEYRREFTDALDRYVTVKDTIKKVVGLSPAITEILFYVTDGQQVIARTQNDHYPQEVKSLPIVANYPKLDMESLLTYQPEVVFAEVGINPKAEMTKAEDYGIKTFWLDLSSLEFLWESMDQVATILHGSHEKVDRLKVQIDSLKSLSPAKKASALVLASASPMYVHGQNTMMTEKLHIAGFENVVTASFSGDYPEISREYLLKLNPEYLLGYSFEAMDTTYFTQYPEMKRLKAYQTKNIYALDSDLASRPGPRVYEAILELKNILHQ